jgi:adenylosuccinate synthase
MLIGPGAVLNVESMVNEIMENSQYFKNKTIIIHPATPVVTEQHREAEKSLVRLGSTMKGSSEALISKIRRNSEAVAGGLHAYINVLAAPLIVLGMRVIVDEFDYDKAIDNAQSLVVEGAQGHSLGIHTRFYPYTTSRDVSVFQTLADCRVPLKNSMIETYGTVRTFPIRVANRYDADGNMIGTSGPCYPDQAEIAWEDLGMKPELTTVTKLPRRIFTMSMMQLQEACRLNNYKYLFLNFANYIQPTAGTHITPDLQQLIQSIEHATRKEVRFLGFGPTEEDIYHVDFSGMLMYPATNKDFTE